MTHSSKRSLANLECTLTQCNNEDYIQLSFNYPLSAKKWSKYPSEKRFARPKYLDNLEQNLKMLGSCQIDVGRQEININRYGAPWKYFLPDIIKHLELFWGCAFPIYYRDTRDPYTSNFDNDGFESSRIPRKLGAIDYGIAIAGEVQNV